MTRSRLAYLGVFLLAFMLSLAVTMPASYAVRLFGLSGGPFMLLAVHGTVWSGGASRTLLFGRDLGAASWHFRPAAISHRCLGWAVTVVGPIGKSGLGLRRCPGEVVRLSAVHLAASAARLAQTAGALPVSFGGDVSADLSELTLVHGWPRDARGTVVWRAAQLTGAETVSLGTVTARIASRQGRITARLAGGAGTSRLEGVLSLGPDRGYRIDAVISAGLARQAHLKELLGKVGVREQDGKYHLTFKGTLRPEAAGGTESLIH